MLKGFYAFGIDNITRCNITTNLLKG